MLFPVFAQANLSYSKEDMIDEAKRHKHEAYECLSRLEGRCYLIPDLKSREHMKALIASAIASAGASGGKGKIVTVGLGYIASLAVNMYDTYCAMRDDLIQSEYHFEMVILYNQLSLHAKFQGSKSKLNLGTKEFFKAIDCLTICELFTTCISDKWERKSVSDNIVAQRTQWLDQFTADGKTLTYKIFEDAVRFYENICEITSDVEEEDIRDEICRYTYGAVESIACALRELKGFDCWPDLDDWDNYKCNYYRSLYMLKRMEKSNG